MTYECPECGNRVPAVNIPRHPLVGTGHGAYVLVVPYCDGAGKHQPHEMGRVQEEVTS